MSFNRKYAAMTPNSVNIFNSLKDRFRNMNPKY